jgi:hypothetical protein
MTSSSLVLSADIIITILVYSGVICLYIIEERVGFNILFADKYWWYMISQVCNLAWSKNVNELVSTHGYSQNQIIVWRYPTMSKVEYMHLKLSCNIYHTYPLVLNVFHIAVCSLPRWQAIHTEYCIWLFPLMDRWVLVTYQLYLYFCDPLSSFSIHVSYRARTNHRHITTKEYKSLKLLI